MSTKQFLALVLVVVFAAQVPTWATDFRYQGIEHRNLITIINNHETRIKNLQSKLMQLGAKLDGDDGVTATDFVDELNNSDAPVTSTSDVHGIITR